MKKELYEFLKVLHLEFEEKRQELLRNRILIQSTINESQGKCLRKPSETFEIRNDSEWKIRGIPKILQDRSVDIVCLDVTNLKTMIECVESGSNGVQVDFDDGYSPSWSNNLKSQKNIETIVNDDRLNRSDKALLLVRPRSMNLDELNYLIDGVPISGTIFDLGVFLFNNGKKLLERGRGPFLYIPKIENYHEAKWWDSLLKRCEQLLTLPSFTIKAIVLIENILASFEMEEIIYHLRDHCIALNTGRWDYIFSYIKKFSQLPNYNIPSKSMLSFNQEFLVSYYNLLSNISHKRGCLATGGMAPHFPSTIVDSATLSDKELLSIFNGKRDEAKMGFDGALIAHRSAVLTCRNAFKEIIGNDNTNHLSSNRLFKFSPIQCESYFSNLIKTCQGLTFENRSNRYQIASVSIQEVNSYLSVLYIYIGNWIFNEKGATSINGVIEDLATSEINRVLLWKWLKFGVAIKEDNNKLLTISKILNLLNSIEKSLKQQEQTFKFTNNQHETIKRLVIQFLTSNQLIDFMPTLLYPYLINLNKDLILKSNL
ncbi:hypothetical protein RB653_001710 [Dictyostelium firmibasis]|uniref:malate synthase n=1 Tax=Dictyostelium firmibasis TaxID=79012 RepID=A0AAN7UH52_9MYCE